VKPNPLFIVAPGVLLAISTIAAERQPAINEPEHAEQNETQQESAQLVLTVLMDALAINTSSGTAATVQFALAPPQFE
jgi:hypothetical protein